MAKRHSSSNGRSVAAVTYIRMSSDKQDASPQQQRDELEKLAKRDGYRVLREYFDPADIGRPILDVELGALAIHW